MVKGKEELSVVSVEMAVVVVRQAVRVLYTMNSGGPRTEPHGTTKEEVCKEKKRSSVN